MRKLSVLLLMVALAFGLAQCKKTADTVAQFGGEKIQITLDVENGRHVVTPSNGQVEYQNGDIIYVGDGNTYIGALVCTNGTFTGEVATPTTANLHFYFLGGVGPNPETLYMASTTSFNVNIANQSDNLPVLSYLQVEYVPGQREYSGILQNKCGLVKFVPASATSEPVRVHGMKTTATIDFANPGITPTDATGTIALYPENDEAKWAILLPQDEVSTPDGMIGKYACTMSNVPEVTANLYSISGVSMTVRQGMLGGLFTINPDGGKVHFSQGNLQAVGTTTSSPASGWTWSFATNQYDYIGNATANTSISGNGTVSTNGTVDLFGWSTANTYYGINNSKNDGDYSGDFVDWGGLTIGEYNPGTWRTLTSDEWMYLFNGRSAIGVETRFAKAYLLGSVHGVILFPDNYTHPEGVAAPTGVNVTGNTSWNANQYNADDWGKMEAAGCVFLPEADGRYGSSVGSGGYYWSSTYSYSVYAYFVWFNASQLNPQYNGSWCSGYSVRLVF